jgi:hypothetical protein
MARGVLTFRQQDVTRALRAAVAAGIEVQRVEIDKSGKIVLIFGDTKAREICEPAALDVWRASRGAR